MKIDNKICIFDVETGGLKAETDALAEIAIMIVDWEFNELERYSSIIAPYGKAYNPKALEVNGLTMSDINGGLELKVVMKSVADIISKHNHGKTKMVVMAGHNTQFDMKFLRINMSDCGLDLDKIIDGRVEDTLWESRKAWGHLDTMENFKLGTCCNKAGIEPEDAHRAMGDVISTKKLLEYHISSQRGSNAGDTGTEEVVASGRAKRKHSFRF